MANPLKKLFPINISVGKQASPGNPFTELLQTKFAQFFGASAKEEQLKAYRSWVFAAVQAISQDVAEIKLRLMKRGADGELEEVTEHEVLELIKKVNPRMTKYEIFEITQSHLELEGNAFWFLARDGTKAIKEIWPLRPDRVILVQDKENPLLVSEYVYKQRGGKKITFVADDIIHFANFNNEGEYPFPVRGLGTVQAAARAIDTNFAASEWNRIFFANSARPDILLKTEGKVDAADAERLKRMWNSAFRGTDKAHKLLILQGGLSVDKLSETQKDMDFVKLQTQSRDEILATFRVPKTVLGLTDGTVNRATAEASNFIFADGTIKPKMQRITDTLNENLLKLFKGTENMFFTFDSPVPEDRERIVKEYTAGHGKWLTTNDIRIAEGLQPTDKGDQLLAPSSFVEVDRVTPEGKKIKEPKEKAEEPAPKVDKEVADTTAEHINKLFDTKAKVKPKKVKAKEEPKEKTRRELTHAQVENFRPIWIKNIKDNEKILSEKIQKFFDGQQKRVIEALTEGLKGLKPKEYRLKQVNDLLPDINVEIDLLGEVLRADFEEFLRQGGQLAFDVLANDETFFININSQEFIDDRIDVIKGQINDTTFEKVRPIIEQGLEENQTVEEISDALARDVFDEARGFRTDRIARTEVSQAQNFGNLEATKIAGATFKRWVNFDPPDPGDGQCGPIPEEVPVDEEFSNGLQHPPKHPNCVCTTIAIFEE